MLHYQGDFVTLSVSCYNMGKVTLSLDVTLSGGVTLSGVTEPNDTGFID